MVSASVAIVVNELNVIMLKTARAAIMGVVVTKFVVSMLIVLSDEHVCFSLLWP